MDFSRLALPWTLVTTALLASACAPPDVAIEADEVEEDEDAIIGPTKEMPNKIEGKAPLLGAADLELVAELPFAPGNVAVSADGRVFFSFHPEGNRGDIQVA